MADKQKQSKLNVDGINAKKLAELLSGRTNTINGRPGIQSLLSKDKKLDSRDVVAKISPFGIDSKEPYKTSDYITKFLTSTSGGGRKSTPVKEDFGMGMKIKTNIRALLEELEEAGEVEGNDDLGTPNFQPDESIVGGMDDLIDDGEDMDKDPESEKMNDDVMSDPEAKANMAEKLVAEGLNKKWEYYLVLEAFVNEMCKLLLEQNIPVALQESEQFNFMLYDLREAVLNDKLPGFSEDMRPKAFKQLIKTVAAIQEVTLQFASAPTKKNAADLGNRFLILRSV